MKISFIKTIFCSLLLASIVTGCANSDNYDAPTASCVNEAAGIEANYTGTQLYAMATSSMQQFNTEGNDYISGYVVSSDQGGNFFKTVSIQTEDDKAFSLTLDVYNTYSKGFEVGRKIYIKLNGLYFQITHSSLILGANYNGNVGRLPEGEIKNHVFKSCEYKSDDELVHVITNINQAKNNNMINKLIELDAVEFDQSEVGQTYYDPNNAIGGATNRTLVDANNNSVIFRTGSYATYAGLKIPNKSGKVRGVMTKYNSDFQFVARVDADIKLTEPRLGDQETNPGEPGETEQPENPGENAIFAFAGGDFEDYSAFIAGLNSQYNPVIKDYANMSAGTGVGGGNSLHINTPGALANDYVFNALSRAGLPTNPTKITFWMKGTASKSLSFNIYKAGGGYINFNLGDVTSSKEVQVAGNNQYTGTINTNGNWIKITLDLTSSTEALNLSGSGDFLALKVGKEAPYDLHLDNFIIE